MVAKKPYKTTRNNERFSQGIFLGADHLISGGGGGGGGVEENKEINKMFPILLKINKLFPSLLEINKLFLKLPEKNGLFHPKKNLFAGLIP